MTSYLVDSRTVPILGMRSAIPKYMCKSGEYPLISNLRWINGAFYGRGGTAEYMDVPTSGAVPVDFWEGELNGTYYKVGAFNVSGDIRLYYSTGTSWTELTGTTTYHGASGNNRFDTQSGRVSFAAIKAPAQWVLSVVPDRDVLLIQNGEDFPRVWDPGQTNPLLACSIHQEIDVPENAKEFRQIATLYQHLQVAGSSGKTYASGGAVNTADFKLADSSSGLYTGDNACPVWTVTSSCSENDIATIQLSTPMVLQSQLIWVVEGDRADIEAMLAQVLIEVSRDNAVYGSITHKETVYDSAGTSEHNKFRVVDIDAANDRYLVYFPCIHIEPAERTVYHLILTRRGTVAPLSTQTVTIVAIGSGAAFPGNCEWTMAYGDGYSRATSPGFVASRLLGAEVGCIGGPDIAGFTLPLHEEVRYDFDLVVRNTATDATPFTGGLNGLPDRINFYLRLNGENKAYFMFSSLLYDPGLVGGVTPGWQQHTGVFLGTEIVVNTNTITYGCSRDLHDRDFDRPAPSEFHIAIPVAVDCLAANSRLFVANIKSNSSYQRGDIYVSAFNRPFDIESAQLTEFDGCHIQINGETIQKLSSVAGAAQGTSYVFCHTDRSFWSLGGSGAFGASDAAVDSLSVPRRIAYAGTRSPRSVAGRNGLLAWVDQDYIFRVYANGELKDISTFHVSDIFDAVPSGMRDDISVLITKDRCYIGLASTGESTNNRVLVFNFSVWGWESYDTLPSPCTAERLITAYVSGDNGSGNRVLLAGSNGKMYSFDGSATTDLGSDISFTLTFPEIDGEDKQVTIEDVFVAATAISKTWRFDRYYRHPVSSQFYTTFSMANGIVTDSKSRTVASAPSDNKGERGNYAYGSLSGAITLAHRVEKVWANYDVSHGSEYKQG